MQTSTSDLKSFYDFLTPRIQADLVSWYGSEAKLIGEPEFRPRPWSYFFRYRVQASDRQEKAILVKIRHTREMDLTQAVASAKMRWEAGEEHGSLAHIQAVFGSADHAAQFFAIRPLGLYEDLNAVVMEEATIRPLRSFLEAPHKLANQQAHKSFETNLAQAGRWLKIFHHAAVKPAGEGVVFTSAMLDAAGQHLAGLGAFITKNELLKISALLEELHQSFGAKLTAYEILHDDFNCANVFITPDQRICSFDPKNPPGSPYVDLARFITDMETCRAQILTNGLAYSPARLQAFRAAFLSGYFNSERIDLAQLNLFRLLDFLGRWHETEIGLADAPLQKKLIYAPVLPLMRRYFRRLLRELIQEKNFKA